MAEAADAAVHEARLKKALQAMQQMRVRLDSLERMNTEPIAIVGMACRFPGGADNPAAYWNLLHNGIDAISEMPAGRWDTDAFYDPDPLAPGKAYTRSGGFLGNIEDFDAEFFGIAPREAMSLDPQQRMLLELSWEALEAAGQAADRLSGTRTGVFIGISTNDYSQFHVASGDADRIDAYSGTGVAPSIAAGRVSYVYGFQGPTMAVDTFCSSSLVAIHLACQSLRHQESDMALAGGVNLILSPAGTIYSCKVRALAVDGRCKTFDASADGYGRGEGCGILVLKRLSDAVAAGDNILAVIRGTAINHDGKSSGLTVPNGLAQQAVIRAAHADAGLDAGEVSYVEAHGTGTPLGDPIELRALAASTAVKRTKADPLIVGSAKTNIGHLEAAAGVAGVIKVALALGKREIPAHLHLETPNRHIPWDELPIEIPRTARAWKPAGRALVAGVSSFGFSGTNAHAILEEAPVRVPRHPASPRAEYILPVSARGPEALAALIRGYGELLTNHPERSLHDICYTAAVRRSHHEHRAAFTGRSAGDLARRIADYLASPPAKPTSNTEDFAVVFPERIAVEDVPGEPAFEEMRTRCESTGAPKLFTLSLAHAALWKSWGIAPQTIVAKGPAAPVAGWFAGTLGFDEALNGAVASGLATTAGESVVLEIGAHPPVEELARLYTIGVPIEWSRLYPVGNPVSLPSYPWQRRRFWIDGVTAIRAHRGAESPREPGAAHPLLGQRLLSPAFTQTVYEATISASSPAFLKEHRFQGKVLFPASGFAEICLAATQSVFDLVIREPLMLLEDQTTRLQTVLSKEGLQIFSLGADDETWKLHASASLTGEASGAPIPDLAGVEARMHSEMSGAEVYEKTRAFGLEYGAAFRGLQRLRWSDTDATGDIELPAAAPEYVLHPALLDSCLQVIGAKIFSQPGSDSYLPSKIGSLKILAKPAARVTCHVSFAANPAPGTLEADLRVINPDGGVAVEARRIVCRQVPKAVVPGDLRYVIEWREKESSFADEQGEPAVWIVLADSAGLAESVAVKLRNYDQQCVMVAAGDSYSFSGPNAVVNPANPEDFRRLIQDAPAKSGLRLAGFVHMWALDTTFDTPNEHAVESAFHAVQALGRAKLSDPPKFCIVTRGGQALAPNAQVSPRSASLAGLGRVIKVEHPGLNPVVIDLAPETSGASEVRFLFEEFLARNPEDLVAFRGGVRSVPRLQRDKAASQSTTTFRRASTYLITGGLGALGLQTAHWLAQRGARHLALLSRGRPSDSSREAIRTLEQQGIDVRVLTANVENADELKTALAGLDPAAPLAGVIHAAGTLDDGLIVQQTWERFNRVLSGKAAGAWNLHELTKDQPLDFFVLFSSAAGLMGSAGQSAYATANAFLDGLAAHRRAAGLPGTSIAWGAWSGAGMAARLGERERRRWAEYGIEAITPDQGLNELGQLMNAPASQIAVLKVEWTRFVRQYPTGGELPLLSDLAREARLRAQTEGAPSLHLDLLRKLEQSSPVERLDILADFVRGQVAEVLGFSSSTGLDPNQGFFEIGMDSLMAVDLQRRLQNGLGVTLSSTIGFDHPTVEALAKHLAEKALKFQSGAVKPASGSAARAKRPVAGKAIDEMSEEQLVALLSKELDKTGGHSAMDGD